jgi:hypothetical protein
MTGSTTQIVIDLVELEKLAAGRSKLALPV